MRWPRREHKERVHALCLLLSLIIVHAETRTRQEKRVVHTNQTPEEAACIASVRIARRSYCPTEAVLAAVESIVRGMEVSRGHPLTLVNIGANKGLNVNEFMMRFQFDWNTSNLDWWTYIGTISKLHPHDHRPACGMSAITTGRHVAADGEALGALAANLAHSRAYAIAVELIGATAVLLEGAFAHFGVPGAVVHAAGGKADGVAGEPRGRPGNELSMVAESGKSGTIDVRTARWKNRQPATI